MTLCGCKSLEKIYDMQQVPDADGEAMRLLYILLWMAVYYCVLLGITGYYWVLLWMVVYYWVFLCTLLFISSAMAAICTACLVRFRLDARATPSAIQHRYEPPGNCPCGPGTRPTPATKLRWFCPPDAKAGGGPSPFRGPRKTHTKAGR